MKKKNTNDTCPNEQLSSIYKKVSKRPRQGKASALLFLFRRLHPVFLKNPICPTSAGRKKRSFPQSTSTSAASQFTEELTSPEVRFLFLFFFFFFFFSLFAVEKTLLFLFYYWIRVQIQRSNASQPLLILICCTWRDGCGGDLED